MYSHCDFVELSLQLLSSTSHQSPSLSTIPFNMVSNSVRSRVHHNHITEALAIARVLPQLDLVGDHYRICTG